MKTFTTPKGTKLPLMDLKGKDYMQPAHRLVWFREDHPDWSLITELKQFSKGVSFEARILDETGRVLATAHAYQTPDDFKHGFIEKCETKAVGRVLSFVGYGTQFAADIDEEEVLADSPLPTVKKDVPEFDPDEVLPF